MIQKAQRRQNLQRRPSRKELTPHLLRAFVFQGPFLFDKSIKSDRIMDMQQADFEELVDQAVLELPEHIRQKMDNVEIIIEERASVEQLTKVGLRSADSLLGLYQGVPQTAWGRGFGNILPDKISIFQQPIEKLAKSDKEIVDLVKNTVWHEIAHHFGFSEKGVRKLEAKRKNKC